MFPQTVQGGNLAAMNPANKQATFGDRKIKERCFCPFGCTRVKCNEVGHCKHLVGFTCSGPDGNPLRDGDGKVLYEPRLKRYISKMDAQTGKKRLYWTGQYYHGEPVTVPDGAQIIEVAPGMQTKRVYVADPPKHAPHLTPERPLDFDE